MLLIESNPESRYPCDLQTLTEFVDQPKLPLALCWFLFMHNNPYLEAPSDMEQLPSFEGDIKVYHSAVAIYYAPSDFCGAGGLHCECICSTPSFHGHKYRDTVFVVLDESKHGMVSRIHIFLLFHHSIFLMIFRCLCGHFGSDHKVQWTNSKPTPKPMEVQQISDGHSQQKSDGLQASRACY